MKKPKFEIRKIGSKVAISRGSTTLWGFKNFQEARKFLKNLKENLCHNQNQAKI